MSWRSVLRSNDKVGDQSGYWPHEMAYLEANPDVATAVTQGLFPSGHRHWLDHGRSEGRKLSVSSAENRDRDKALALIDKAGLGLEIGPSHNPIAPKSAGYRVEIVDHLDRESLLEKYRDHNVDLSSIEEVDYVWHGEPLDRLTGRSGYYDWIVASHVLEHLPDPISFLIESERILNDTGVLSLIIPDKRYCFDFFQPVTSTGVLLDAWSAKPRRPSGGQLFDHISSAALRSGALAWRPDGLGGADALAHSVEAAIEAWRDSFTSELYVDVHCWRFTPSSFSLILSDLRRLGLVTLGAQVAFDTEFSEFYVSLTKNFSGAEPDRLKLLKMAQQESLGVTNLTDGLPWANSTPQTDTPSNLRPIHN